MHCVGRFPDGPARVARDWRRRCVVFFCVSCGGFEAAAGDPAPYRIAWGDLHGHTSLSDGQGSLDDYFRNARDAAHLDFVAVTDHDFGNGPPWRMSEGDWKRTQDKADEHTVDGRFIAIAGYEWTSQEKYWNGVGPGVHSERLFPGSPKYYNHKNVYFPRRVDSLFSAKDPDYMSPDRLAEAVRAAGGLVHNSHPSANRDGADQFDYTPANAAVIANTEMMPDSILYQGGSHEARCEEVVREFLNRGGRTGFVAGSDTHEGKPAARTAVLVSELTRDAVFDALRHRRNYAVNNARIALDFRIDDHLMGEEIEIDGAPRIVVDVKGTAPIMEVAIVRDGKVLWTFGPGREQIRIEDSDRTWAGPSYYYARVTQVDTDVHGNRSRAWSSPIWVRRKR